MTSSTNSVKRGLLFSSVILSLLVFASCASTPAGPEGSVDARTKLTELQNDPNLAQQARTEIRDAEEAVRLAEIPVSKDNTELGAHRVYIADRKVAIAQAKATSRYAEVQRNKLSEEREIARLQARTQEANRARQETEQARSDADAAQASSAQAAKLSADQAADYQRQIDELKAKPTDRGLVLTLGDVLFTTGSADLQDGANNNLNRLVSFLKQYPERNVQIEGHTDNVGSSELNQTLSKKRADSVKNHLTQQGIASQRVSTRGLSMNNPVSSNETALGRQQNRRVEIIIADPA